MFRSFMHRLDVYIDIFYSVPNMPSIERVAALADYFGTTIDAICGRSTELPPDEEVLLKKYRCLDADQKKNAIDYIMFLMSQTPIKNDTAIS